RHSSMIPLIKPGSTVQTNEATSVASVNTRMGLPVEEIALVQSVLSPSGAVYTRLFSAPLGHAS
ncbi:MAG: hypothetical protein O2783_06730, partial [Chloroflexi bacterium]|nr:hypothetical protein [Chloroflexota bacterium]